MAAPTRLTWICHAPTAATRQSAFPVDEAIEDEGRAAAKAIARQIGTFDTAYAAPERRALQTAEALGIKASVESELRDCDYGRWAGRSLAELAATEQDALSAWLSEPRATPHGGESLNDTIRRVSTWLDRRAFDKARLIAVSHPSVIRAAIVYVLSAPPSSFWRIDVPPLTRVRMSHDGRQWKLAIGIPARLP